MALKITVPNSSSENLTFGSAQTPVAAEVVGIDSGSSNGQLAFKTTAGGASTERMRIDASGNVMIGATSPLAPLTVYNSSNPYMALGNTLYTTYFNQTSTDFHLYTNAAYPLRFGTNNTERMRINSVGSREYSTYSTGSINTGEATVKWDNVSSTTIDLSVLFPDVNGYANGASVIIQVMNWNGALNSTSSYLINLARSTTAWTTSNTSALLQSGAVTITTTASGNIITLTFSGGGQYGVAAVRIVSRT